MKDNKEFSQMVGHLSNAVEKNRVIEARRAARKATLDANERAAINGWLALVAAAESHPGAAAKLRRCLRQRLPFRLKARLEAALAESPAPRLP